jgi:hypothetical protein
MSHFQALYGYAPPWREWITQEPTPVVVLEAQDEANGRQKQN